MPLKHMFLIYNPSLHTYIAHCLHYFQATEHIAAGIGQCLALLHRDAEG